MQDFIASLTAALGPEQVRTDAEALEARRFDQWAVSHLRAWRGDAMARPAAVVRVRDVADVQKTLALANARKVSVIPFGLGSGVCGGVVANPEAIVLDLSAMNRVHQIDEINLLASFDAGLNGMKAEEAVAALGLTIGHWPQSIAISSVGGWISTRASGQFSTLYGNIEDIVHSIEVVLPNGELVVLGKAPRAAAGPDLRHVFMGAEGTLGVVTGVTLKLRREAPYRTYSVFFGRDMDQGFELQRRMIQADLRPPVLRQYDAREVRRLFRDHDRGGQAMLLAVHEGSRKRVEVELEDIRALAAEIGMDEGSSEIGKGWMAHRNNVHAWREMLERGLIADTVEISGSWTQIGRIYDDAIASLNEVPDILNASAHSSHAYQTGLNLYFSFAVKTEDGQAREAAYFECWRRIMEATAKHGGGVAHHHGMGRVRKPYLHHDLGEGGVGLLRALKAAIDPNGIMNPGNLLPDA